MNNDAHDVIDEAVFSQIFHKVVFSQVDSNDEDDEKTGTGARQKFQILLQIVQQSTNKSKYWT